MPYKENLYKEQRVGIFVDVQNLYYSARHLYNTKVDFRAILNEAINDRKLIRAIAYVVKTPELKEQTFFDALANMGFEVKSKDLQTFYGGAKKGDWDVGIAMDTIELAPKLDVVVLISGDGDYIPLVDHLKRATGCRVEVIAFSRSASSKLIEHADEYVDLDTNAKRWLIKSNSKPTREQNIKPTTQKPTRESSTKTKKESISKR